MHILPQLQQKGKKKSIEEKEKGLSHIAIRKQNIKISTNIIPK